MNRHFISAASAFALAFALGACTAPEIESCDKFRETRDSCEAANGAYKPVNFDLCNNVDPECKEFYDCAVQQLCVDVNEGKKNVDPYFRLNYRDACPQPEDKECTDEDLRVLIEDDEE